eukprot:TRINITY_DN3919_c0_g1_i6.p1 TRINITY_DN3919_c0_g1~~TRINITY_DN3919_c0_g1_i6.p1  ORF type:complete len:728 (-),score=35.10 TRINITY_DN3919_c0_g1_i6:50-2233(-)
MSYGSQEAQGSIRFFKVPGCPVRVPRSFSCKSLEAEFTSKQSLVQYRWTFFLFSVFILYYVVPLAIGYEDVVVKVFAGRAEPWNHLVLWGNFLGALAAMVALVTHCIRPSYFTGDRRLLFAMFQLFLFYVLNRPIILAYFSVEWPYTNVLEPHPFSAWVVIASMFFATLLCHPAAASCSRSWAACVFSCLLLIGFQVFAVQVGKMTVTHTITPTLIVVTQNVIAYSGHVAVELAERRAFLLLKESKQVAVEERTKRYVAERQAETAQRPPMAQSSGRSEIASERGSQFSSVIFGMLLRTDPTQDDNASGIEYTSDAIASIANDEHWLIQPEDLVLHPHRVLGSGGYGSVVLGTWKLAPVAVKVPRARRRGDHHPLALELRHLRKLRHPCIVSFFGVCIEHKSVEMVLVEEYVKGDNLLEFMIKFESFAIKSARLRWRILLDISAALHYLHTQRPAIMHGDLKPNNILIDYSSTRAKLTDFGLARRAASGDVTHGGTKEWIEPFYRIHPFGLEVKASVDMWAFGAVGFYLATGLCPSDAHLISGSSSTEEFGECVLGLWHGSTVVGTTPQAQEKPTHRRKRSVPPLEDFIVLRKLCCSCMSEDSDVRPTAHAAHKELLTWYSSVDVMGSSTREETQRTRTLLDQVLSVRTAMSNGQAGEAGVKRYTLSRKSLEATTSALVACSRNLHAPTRGKVDSMSALALMPVLTGMLLVDEDTPSSKSVVDPLSL